MTDAVVLRLGKSPVILWQARLSRDGGSEHLPARRFQGQGLGKLILAQVMAECPGLGVDTLLAFVFGHNEPSLRLFSGLGFEKWARLPEVAELDGVKRDLVILGRKV